MRTRHRESRGWFGIPLLALPSIAWLAIPPLVFGVSLFDYVPGFDNDEIHYWHEILTFSEVGFSGGYYTVDELPAPAAFSPFGTEGPAFAFLYGSLAKVFGWHPFSPAFYNAVLVFFCLAGMSLLARSPSPASALIAVLTATYWPLAIVAPTIMQEPLHNAAAILLAGVFYRFVRNDRSSGGSRWLGGLTIAVMSTVRCTWSAFSAPFLLLALPWSRMRAIVWSLVFVSLAFLVASWWASPYPRYTLWPDLMSGHRWVHRWLLWNGSNFFRLVDEPYGAEAATLGLMLRCQMAAIVIYAGWRLSMAVRNEDRVERAIMALILFSLLHIVLAQILFYSVDNFHDYRVFGPYLLFVLILLILFERFGVVALVIASNLLAAPTFLEAYAVRNIEGVDYVRRGPMSKNVPASLGDFEKAVRGALVYRPDSNRWCNTLLTRTYRSQLIAVPAGIGLSALLDAEELSLPPKSKYILLADNDPLLRSSDLRLERLAHTPEGTLHYNPDSGCPR
ncbi:MAG TPA: hypothetical protein VLK65_32600 [Vicinamibacteria bacterium]|nr:hypothetical protein [Vicinamibacteria bacterium]